LGERHLLIAMETHTLQHSTQVQVIGIDLETQLRHDHLQFILKLFVCLCILMEVAIEDGMQKDLVPGKTISL